MSEMTSNFINQKKDFANQAALKQYNKFILEKFKTPQEAEQYLDLVRKIVGNKKFSQSLTDAVKALPMPSYSSKQLYIPEIKKDLLNDLNEFQKLQNELKESLGVLISTLGVEDFLLIDEKLNAKSLDALKDIYGSDQKIYNKMITSKNYKENIESQFRGQYRYLLNLLPDFATILNSTSTPTEASLQIIQKLLGPLQRLIGICAEFKTVEEIEKILSDLTKELKLSDGVTIKRVGGVGENKTANGFSTQTADVSINFRGKESIINVNFPNLGMTLKRTRKNIKTSPEIKIQLKSGTSYGMLIKDIDSKIVNAFYNIYVNDNYTLPVMGGVKQQQLPKGTLTEMYKYMKSLMGVTALIGDAKSEDLVFVLVINERAYTIFDLLTKMSEDSLDKAFHLKPAFSTARKGLVKKHRELYEKYSPEEKNMRSSQIINAIDSTKAGMLLKISNKYL